MNQTPDPDRSIYGAANRMIAAVRAGDSSAVGTIVDTPGPDVHTKQEWQVHLLIALATMIADHLRARVPAGISAAEFEQALLIPADGWQARAELAESGQEITPREADELTRPLAKARQVTAMTIVTCLPVSPDQAASYSMVKSLMELIDTDPGGATAATSMLVRIAADIVPAP